MLPTMLPVVPPGADAAPNARNDFERRLGIDQEIVNAKHDVDVTLLEWNLSLSPLERVEVASRLLRGISSFRIVDAASEDR